MKLKKTITSAAFLTLGLGGLHAQESVTASGGDGNGDGGSISFSIAQTVIGNNGEGVQQPLEIYPVGINQELSSIILLTYPNPTSDFLTLDFSEISSGKVDYKLINIEGKTLLSKPITNLKTQIDLRNYSKGIYFIKVIKESKEIRTFKIIKN